MGSTFLLINGIGPALGKDKEELLENLERGKK
jgi:hypothetical protein